MFYNVSMHFHDCTPVVHENEGKIMWIKCVLDFIYVYTYFVVMYIVCFFYGFCNKKKFLRKI